MLKYLTLAAFMALAVPAHAQKAQVSVGGVTVHLFFEITGTFSADVTRIKNFSSWNFVPMGKGLPDNDRFNAFLVKVELTSRQEVFAEGRQATVRVRQAETGKVLVEQALDDIYVGPGGSVTKPVLVTGHVCEPLDVVVEGGGKTVKKHLAFNCGE